MAADLWSQFASSARDAWSSASDSISSLAASVTGAEGGKVAVPVSCTVSEQHLSLKHLLEALALPAPMLGLSSFFECIYAPLVRYAGQMPLGMWAEEGDVPRCIARGAFPAIANMLSAGRTTLEVRQRPGSLALVAVWPIIGGAAAAPAPQRPAHGADGPRVCKGAA